MIRNSSHPSLGLPLGIFLAVSLSSSANAKDNDNPFQSNPLSSAFQTGIAQADKPEDCPMTREDKQANKIMMSEGKCGEGKCGTVNLQQAKCGADKCGVENRIREGRCKEQ
jgi:uncharacterized low-complexity protein